MCELLSLNKLESKFAQPSLCAGLFYLQGQLYDYGDFIKEAI